MDASHAHDENYHSIDYETPAIETNEKGKKKNEVFKCKYCERQSTSPQAMGGHQNAHKAERKRENQSRLAMDITRYGLDSSIIDQPHPYQEPAFGSDPRFGSRLGFGVNRTSVIREPYTGSSHLELGHVGHNSSAWPSVGFNHQPPQPFWATGKAISRFDSASASGFVGGGLSAGLGLQGASSPFQSPAALGSFGQRSNYSQEPEVAQTEELDLELRL